MDKLSIQVAPCVGYKTDPTVVWRYYWRVVNADGHVLDRGWETNRESAIYDARSARAVRVDDMAWETVDDDG